MKIERVDSLSLKVPTRLVSILVFVGLGGAGCVQAQTEKTVRGQHGPTPYISHAEFQDISVGGGTVSGKSSSSRPTFRDILTVASLDEVARRFGEPTSIEYNRFPEGSSTDYKAILTYDGMKLWYRKIRGKVRLQTMVITSEDRFLRVGGVKLRPGMSTDSLSAVMRKAVEDDDDGVAVLRVERPGKSENLRSVQDSRTKVSVEVDKRNHTVKEVKFNRIVL